MNALRLETLGRVAMVAGMMTLATQGATHLLHHPAMNRTKIVFSYAGDLWSVGREGGSAVRLTVGAGIENEPVMSPDGETIAFTGEYDGNVDVYTMPVAGGVPKRVTHHPAPDAAVGWTPDGKQILIRSGRNSRKGYGRYTNLFVVSPGGGLPEMLPLPLAFSGAYSADGRQMVYAPLDGGQFLRTPERWVAWKRYRGGMASYLWQVNLADLSTEKIPRTDSNDINPMWVGGKVYFLSDRKRAMTLYRYDGGGKAPVEVIANTGADIRNAQAGPGGIVYEQFGQIAIFDPASGKSRAVPITIDADLGEVRARLQNVSSEVENAGLSATGVRAVFEAHGEILTVPAEKGDIRNLTRTPGVMEREPAWSPDGQWVAYFSDEGHEYALHVKAQSGEGEVKKIALAGKSAYYRLPVWSPDSKHIAFRDNQLHVWRVEIATGKLTLVDTEPYVVSLPEMEAMAWSPDSQWLAYGRPMKNLFSAVFLHSVATGKNIQVTDGMNDARYPAFDREGKYLYFTSSTNAGPALSGLDMTSDEHEVTRAVYAAVLAADGKPPLGPESDEEKPREAEGEKKKEAGAAPVVRVDADGLPTRMAALPVPVRGWTRLACAQDGSLLLLEGPDSMTALRGGGTSKLSRYDMKVRKLTMLAEGVEGFALSADGAKMLLQLKGEGGGAGRWVIAGALEPLKPGQKDLQVAGMEVEVDPRAEWKQMFREVWRIERSFFYDANLHGLNAVESEERYATYLESLAARDDLNYIFQEMLGPMTAGHLRGGGGTVPRGKQVKTGLLGADFAIENGRYRIRKIYSGGLWTPELKPPLSGPGIDVKEGDYLLAVEGRELAATDNLFEMLAGTVGRQIALRVAADANGAGARVVRVEPVEDEQLLRRYTWMDESRKKVEELSGGRLGYVHLPDTAYGGLTHFNRYFFAQADKAGMILDERMNNGGQVADYIIDVLRRPVQSWGAPRYGLPLKSPGASNQGPKVMIIDELAGSGGDMLPWMFRYAKLGPLVGKRTWGGLIGISAFPSLMDGGRVTAPNFRLYSNEGEWIAENTGVAPDVEVELDPKLMAAGRDAQLERAVALAMEALRRNPPVRPKQPPYPDFNKAERSGAGGKGGR